MALYVNTNISSKNAQRMLANSTTSLDTSYKRLASGLRINSAKDDAAGLQISNRLSSQINGLEQGNRNAQDAISYAQTAEGAMDEMTTMYQRIRTLALQSANGTNSAKDRIAIQEEVSQLCAEIDRISQDTTFGGENILTGEKSVGFNATKAAQNPPVYEFELKAGVANFNLADSVIDFQVGADAYQTISCDLGNKVKDNDDDTVGFSVADLAYSFTADNASLSADDGYLIANPANNNEGATFDVTTAEAAQRTLANIDKFIAAVDSKRAELGAVQNRMESTIRNQSNISENVSDARSRIRDTDFALETANMTQTSIIQQASQSILSQANQRPQMALSLLGQ